MRTLFHEFYIQPVSQVQFEVISVYLLCTVVMLFLNQKTRRFISYAGTIIGFVIIFMFTILGRDSSLDYYINLIPFSSFVKAQISPAFYRAMFMNVFLFMPLGLSLPFALTERINHKAAVSVLIGMLTSVTVELTQYLFHIGQCETDDVIMNTLGTFAGATSYILIMNITKRKDAENLISKIKFFLISIIPMTVSAIVIDFKPITIKMTLSNYFASVFNNYFIITCMLFVMIGIVAAEERYGNFRGTVSISEKITSVKSANYEYFVYTLLSIVLLICLFINYDGKKIIFLALMVIFGIVAVKTDLYIANPILAVFGFRLYKTSGKIKVITRVRLRTNDSVEYKKLSDTCYYIISREE